MCISCLDMFIQNHIHKKFHETYPEIKLKNIQGHAKDSNALMQQVFTQFHKILYPYILKDISHSSYVKISAKLTFLTP